MRQQFVQSQAQVADSGAWQISRRGGRLGCCLASGAAAGDCRQVGLYLVFKQAALFIVEVFGRGSEISCA